ncbi:MAG TPA: hypothetical protein VGG85_13245 [Terracidiphilus sp.]|jgi:hypothetical protein
MKVSSTSFGIALLAPTLAISAFGQAPVAQGPAAQAPTSWSGEVSDSPALPPSSLHAAEAPAIAVPSTLGPAITPAVQLLRDFRTSDVKFDVRELMNLLRDRQHEGWVLAAYPDPKTGQPLIGAGVSLDLPAREHPQNDPLNPHIFLEPSSAELWQAAGLEPQHLQQILARFNQRLAASDFRTFRSQIRDLPPDIDEEQANLLLRIAAVQAIDNAKAYCRHFDQLSGPQQMALSQLVYQMGFNLQEFSLFLGLINDDSLASPASAKLVARDVSYWRSVQQSLIQSQWARLYRTRAISVIAMLDPRYNQNPRMAERRVGATLRPAVVHRRRGRRSGSTELASNSRTPGTHPGKRSRAHSRRRV